MTHPVRPNFVTWAQRTSLWQPDSVRQ